MIGDEGHRNPMTVEQLAGRMKEWLRGDYRGVIFAVDDILVGYALYRNEEATIYLRQLFVRRDERRAGIGQAAMAILRREIWPRGVRLTVDVLCANHAAVAFWRHVGYRDYSLTLEIMPE